MKKCISLILALVAALCLLLSGCGGAETQNPARANAVSAAASLADIPAFSGQPYVVLHDNKPDFSESDFSATSFERYSPLDSLGRCGAAFANIGRDIMPTEKRGAIGQVKPSGRMSAAGRSNQALLPSFSKSLATASMLSSLHTGLWQSSQ